MSRSSESRGCRQVLESLEPWLDGELGPVEDAAVRQHLAACPACDAQGRLAVEIRSELRALPELHTPPAVIERIFDQTTRRAPARPAWSRLLSGLPRPAWAAMAAAALVLAIALATLWSPQPEPVGYTDAEIARATAEARFALTKAGLLTAEAGRMVRDRAIRDQIVGPTQRVLSRSLAPTPRGHGVDEGVNDV